MMHLIVRLIWFNGIIKILKKKWIFQIPTIDPYSNEGIFPDKFKGNISFENVSFSYPTRKNIKVFYFLCLTTGKIFQLSLRKLLINFSMKLRHSTMYPSNWRVETKLLWLVAVAAGNPQLSICYCDITIRPVEMYFFWLNACKHYLSFEWIKGNIQNNSNFPKL